jgi:hypothetical protein
MNNAFTDVGCNDLDTIRWKLFVDVSPDVNIEGERFLQMREHGAGASWSPHLKGRLSS